jgi:Astacin (Peptidase family M12A)/Bacterial pre-peptidase C-terminal domain
LSKAPKMCFDRILPTSLRREQRVRAYAPGRVRAISLIGKQWVNGTTISIRFMGGTQQQQDMVKQIAPEWTHYANLHFEFTDAPTAQIRVTFDPNDGAWSYVGTDNLNIPLHAATLNLGWQDEGVILHEFGHMVGLSHEHQNPDGGIQWNEQVVIDTLGGPPNFWDPETVRHNVLEKYAADQLHGTVFDPDSIMLYAFPASWTLNGFGTHENEKLSAMDKDFVRSAEMYPPTDEPIATATEVPVSRSVAASIGAPGEVDLFTFVVTEAGLHTVETLGSTDVVMTLFGPDNPTQKVAEDDDGGAGHNAQIVANLAPGSYFVQVRHFSEQSTGDYRILVSR